MEYFNELLSILNEMSPYLLSGFFISGPLHVYVPRSIYSRFLHRKGFRSVLGAAALGVPLSLWSCGVIPTSVSHKKEGASAGAVISFLFATPQTGVDSILATYWWLRQLRRLFPTHSLQGTSNIIYQRTLPKMEKKAK